jgi:hypothetical protein
MKSFLITFRPISESKRGWPLEDLQNYARRSGKGEIVKTGWRFINRKDVSIGDRVFLLMQGKMGPAIIGYGTVRELPKQDRKGTWFAGIDLESVVDPEAGVLLGKEPLRRMSGGPESLGHAGQRREASRFRSARIGNPGCRQTEVPCSSNR